MPPRLAQHPDGDGARRGPRHRPGSPRSRPLSEKMILRPDCGVSLPWPRPRTRGRGTPRPPRAPFALEAWARGQRGSRDGEATRRLRPSSRAGPSEALPESQRQVQSQPATFKKPQGTVRGQDTEDSQSRRPGRGALTRAGTKATHQRMWPAAPASVWVRVQNQRRMHSKGGIERLSGADACPVHLARHKMSR